MSIWHVLQETYRDRSSGRYTVAFWFLIYLVEAAWLTPLVCRGWGSCLEVAAVWPVTTKQQSSVLLTHPPRSIEIVNHQRSLSLLTLWVPAPDWPHQGGWWPGLWKAGFSRLISDTFMASFPLYKWVGAHVTGVTLCMHRIKYRVGLFAENVTGNKSVKLTQSPSFLLLTDDLQGACWVS